MLESGQRGAGAAIAAGDAPIIEVRTFGAGGAKPPLFFIHPGGMAPGQYAAVAARLGRPLHVLSMAARSSEGFGLAGQPGSLPALAAAFGEHLGRLVGEGPFALGGWSLGAAMAFEVGAALAASGRRPQRLVLVDPIRLGARPDLFDDAAWFAAFSRFLGARGDPERPRAEAPAFGALSQDERWGALGRYAAEIDLDASPDALRAMREAFEAGIRASYEKVRHHRFAPLALPVLVLRAAQGLRAEADDLGWDHLDPATLSTITVPGDHYSLWRVPHVDAVAEALARFL
jgi:syringomycin synthetase protein SyrE